MKRSWIPNLITGFNITSGFLSIIFLFKGNYPLSFGVLFFAGFLDAIDGRIARYLQATSDFGKELDSLADLVSFGVAPALILSTVISNLAGNFLFFEYIIPTIYLICGACRLARYNVLNIKDHFVGIPIPFAALFLILLIIIIGNIHTVYSPIIIIAISLIVSVLMVSNFKFPRIWV